MRALGWSYREIALELRRNHRLNARVAYRLAHGWTQEDVARRWNERWPGTGSIKTGKAISYWEVWPAGSGRAPSARTLARLAELYHCRPGDLLDGLDSGELEAVPARPRPATGLGRGLRAYRQEEGGFLAGAVEEAHPTNPVAKPGAASNPAAVPAPALAVVRVSGPGHSGPGGEAGRHGAPVGPAPDVDEVRAPVAVMVHQDGPQEAGRAA
ncbi:hypothetical protein UG55_109918 [Frankia sp. EI5c]|nr:hypothetical protein UG55_109918 [Frankia sp. EI5c]